MCPNAKCWLTAFLLYPLVSFSQQDSIDNERLAKMVSLSEVIIRSDMNVSRFIEQVKNDTTFYKAFKNLRVLGFTSWNDIRIKDKKGGIRAALMSKTKQLRSNGCRSMQVLSEKTTGDFYESDGSYNYYTADLYASLFFTTGTICGENNIVKGTDFKPRSKSGLAKHKEQLKMLFFNPGKKIPGIPFIGSKINIFDPDKAALYDFLIDFGDYEGQSCYVFTIRSKQGISNSERSDIVIDSMVTFFNTKTMEVMARRYDMSFDAGVYDFDVHMEVEMTKVGSYLVPKLLRYIGNWDVVMKKRERGMFTATLFDFTN
jgi:hypothetical protein